MDERLDVLDPCVQRIICACESARRELEHGVVQRLLDFVRGETHVAVVLRAAQPGVDQVGQVGEEVSDAGVRVPRCGRRREQALQNVEEGVRRRARLEQLETELDAAAEELTARMRMHNADVRTEIVTRLEAVHNVSIRRRVDLGETVLHRYDPRTRVLEINRHLSGGQQVFKMAAELAYLECGREIDALVDGAGFGSEEAGRLARLGLANYYAAAVVLPYTQFHGAAEEFEYDIERLSAFFSVSYETIAHRMSTLQRPNLRGVPLSFVRVDRAGNMSKRQSSTGFHFSASGGTCPLWNVYETFAWPGKIITQIVEMPDGRNYLWVARTVERRAARYGQPGKTFAIGIGCELRHAHRLVYARGLDLSDANATPIGAGCRVCERAGCPQRAFPAIGKALDIDEHRSTISPYLVR